MAVIAFILGLVIGGLVVAVIALSLYVDVLTARRRPTEEQPRFPLENGPRVPLVKGPQVPL